MSLAGLTRVCAKNTAGNSLLWLIEASKISAVTIVADEVTVLTTTGTAADMQVYEVDQDTLVRIEEGKGNGSNISYIHAIEFTFSKPSAALRTALNALADASPCGMVAIMRDGNGVYWVIGWNALDLGSRGLRLVQDNFTSGLAPDDEAGSKSMIRLECKSGQKDLPVKSTSTVATAGPNVITAVP
jgi:hypothetical protein